VRVGLVSHLHALALDLWRDPPAPARFLRAGRGRTYRLAEGEPLPTSHGGDAFRRLFGTDPRPPHV
jgi:hypothetical protein